MLISRRADALQFGIINESVLVSLSFCSVSVAVSLSLFLSFCSVSCLSLSFCFVSCLSLSFCSVSCLSLSLSVLSLVSVSPFLFCLSLSLSLLSLSDPMLSSPCNCSRAVCLEWFSSSCLNIQFCLTVPALILFAADWWHFSLYHLYTAF